jgi:general secretion pathway protein G
MRTRAAGFTLIELMVVIVILGLLVAIVAPNVFRQEERATRGAAEAQMAAIADAVRLYALDAHRLPERLEDLLRPARGSEEAYLPSLPRDPWGRAYGFVVTDARRRRFEIQSDGPDRVAGTEDDLAWPARAAE